MKTIFIILFVFLGLNLSYGKNYVNEQPNYLPLDSVSYANLRAEHNNNITLVSGLKHQILIALNNFPELKNVEIIFEYGKLNTTMTCKPVTSSLFGKRKYVIKINNDLTFAGPLLSNVPFNAQIGIIAHEFAHVVDYETQNVFGLIYTAFRYLNTNTRDDFEKGIDEMTIAHGYGWQLKDWADYVQNSKKVTEEYKEYKTIYYLTGTEIVKKIELNRV
ncbi:MAG: hypothetical protein KAG96_06715 [Ichthyobacteriaceae bacterium]|nr:hypothetical protein [Ichthyobacteriaceae bacterium]